MTPQAKSALTREIKQLEAYIIDMQSTRRGQDYRWRYLGMWITERRVNLLKAELEELKKRRNQSTK